MGARGSETASPLNARVCWSIVLAGVLRELINIFWWCVVHLRKYKEASPELQSLWHPRQLLVNKKIAVLVLQSGTTIWFFSRVIKVAAVEGEKLNNLLLALMVVLSSGKVIHKLRFALGGGTIISIFTTFLSSAMQEMFFLTFLVFMS